MGATTDGRVAVTIGTDSVVSFILMTQKNILNKINAKRRIMGWICGPVQILKAQAHEFHGPTSALQPIYHVQVSGFEAAICFRSCFTARSRLSLSLSSPDLLSCSSSDLLHPLLYCPGKVKEGESFHFHVFARLLIRMDPANW